MADIQPSGQTASEAVKPLVIVCIVYLVLNSFFVMLRFASRFVIRRSELGWDDWFIIPAFVCNVGACVCGLLIAHYESIGNRAGNLPIIQPDQLEAQLQPILKLAFATVILSTLGFSLPKLSILALYLRIFSGWKTRIISYVLIGVVIFMAIAYLVAGVLLCEPVQYFWDRTIAGGKCMDINFYYRSFGLPNILIDIAMLVTPLPAIWGLEASFARRLGFTAIFLTGILALVASCVRWSIYSKIDGTSIVPDKNAPLVYINIIECSTYLIAACLPASYPAFEALVPKRFRSKFHLTPASPFPMKYPYAPPRHAVSPAMVRMASDQQLKKSASGFARLADSPERPWSPEARPESRDERTQKRHSRDLAANKNGAQVTGSSDKGGSKVHMGGYGRSESRAETVRRDEEDEIALTELRRLAGQHRIPIDGSDGLIAVHTEIDVTQE